MSKLFENVAIGSATFVLIIGVIAAIYMLFAWGIMLLQGAIAPHFGWHTWGFGLTFLITLALALVASFFNKGKK